MIGACVQNMKLKKCLDQIAVKRLFYRLSIHSGVYNLNRTRLAPPVFRGFSELKL